VLGGVRQGLSDLQASLLPGGARLQFLETHASTGRPREVPGNPAPFNSRKKYNLAPVPFLETTSTGPGCELQCPCDAPIQCLERLARLVAGSHDKESFEHGQTIGLHNRGPVAGAVKLVKPQFSDPQLSRLTGRSAARPGSTSLASGSPAPASLDGR